jgi:YqaJ-like viral recombinase domain
MTIIWHDAEQGSDEWIAARRGAITGSRIREARDKLKGGQMSKAAIAYAQDVARERCGGIPAPVYVNAAMRTGTEQEPVARMQYESETGYLIEEVGFAATDDGKFGCSVDGLIGADGVWECKTMVSSATLFTAIVDGDISAYRDQCLFAMWLLGRKWVDLSLWCPDLQMLHTVRLTRNEDELTDLETDLMAFERFVDGLKSALTDKLHLNAALA